MKKLAVLLGLGGMLMLVVSMAMAQSDWAYYKENPVQICDLCGEDVECFLADGYTGPRIFIQDPIDPEYPCEITYTLDCCACHGPDAPGNHGGPKLPAHQCP